MTTAELIENFSYYQDERASPNLEEDEILVCLNAAQSERLRRLIPDDQGGLINFELDSNTLFNVRRLIYPITTTMTSGGVTTFSTVQTALRTASGDAGCGVHRILGITATVESVDYPVKYTKHNNWDSYKRNTFKAGKSTAPRFKADATNLTFDPINTSASIKVTCMKTPLILTAGNSPDWDDQNCELIIQIALQLAATATRDQELLGSIQNSNVSK